MAISVGGGGDEAPMAEINTTPLVDVMLVLLIIFLITVPVVIQTIPLSLPNVRSVATETKPENILVSVDAQGEVFIEQTRMDDYEELRQHLRERIEKAIDDAGGELTSIDQMPELHIRGDSNVEYQNIGGVIFTAQRAGLMKIAFISEPPAGNVQRAVF